MPLFPLAWWITSTKRLFPFYSFVFCYIISLPSEVLILRNSLFHGATFFSSFFFETSLSISSKLSLNILSAILAWRAAAELAINPSGWAKVWQLALSARRPGLVGELVTGPGTCAETSPGPRVEADSCCVFGRFFQRSRVLLYVTLTHLCFRYHPFISASFPREALPPQFTKATCVNQHAACYPVWFQHCFYRARAL